MKQRLIFSMLDNYIEIGHVHRTVGSNMNPIVLAAGFMSKAGEEDDFTDYKHNRHALIYVLNGNGTFIDKNGVNYSLETGSYFHRYQGEKHTTRIDPNSNWLEYFIDLPEVFTAPYQLLDYFDKEIPVGSSPPAKKYLNEMVELTQFLKVKSDFECRELIPKMLDLQLRIMDPLKVRQSNPNREYLWIEDACRYFSKNIRERFSIHEYCIENGMGYEKFRKEFVSLMHISPAQYCIRRRIDHAIELLMNTTPKRTITDIAEELGYKSSFEFSSQFKSVYKLSPQQYRKKFL